MSQCAADIVFIKSAGPLLAIWQKKTVFVTKRLIILESNLYDDIADLTSQNTDWSSLIGSQINKMKIHVF